MHTHAVALTYKDQLVNRQVILFSLVVISLYILFMNPAFAGASTPMGTVLCAVVDMIYGNLGRGLATLAIIIVGVGATLGKVSWGLAITVAIGISIIFNATTIAGALGAGISGC